MCFYYEKHPRTFSQTLQPLDLTDIEAGFRAKKKNNITLNTCFPKIWPMIYDFSSHLWLLDKIILQGFWFLVNVSLNIFKLSK